MTRHSTLRLVASGAAVAAVAAVPLSAQAAAGATVLKATVGPGFTITLTNAKGVKVKTLKAGAYTIKVSDLSDIHNFHLTGRGVNKDSGVGKKGASTWNVTLKRGAYKFVCDPHATIMKGAVTVS